MMRHALFIIVAVIAMVNGETSDSSSTIPWPMVGVENATKAPAEAVPSGVPAAGGGVPSGAATPEAVPQTTQSPAVGGAAPGAVVEAGGGSSPGNTVSQTTQKPAVGGAAVPAGGGSPGNAYPGQDTLPNDASANSKTCGCSQRVMKVCGSDNKTYLNRCALLCVQKKRPGVILVKRGPCSETNGPVKLGVGKVFA